MWFCVLEDSALSCFVATLLYEHTDFFACVLTIPFHSSHSMALNFDEYTKGWGAIGTSLPSDAKDCRDKY